VETHSSLPIESHAQDPPKLLDEAMSCAPRSTDRRQTQLASQIVGRGTQLDLETLGPDRLSGQVREKQSGIGTERQAESSRRAHPHGMTTVDPFESVALLPAMGEGGHDQKSWHEAEGTGCKSVSGLERETVPCLPLCQPSTTAPDNTEVTILVTMKYN